MESSQSLITRQEKMYGKIQDYLSREITQKEYCQQENLSYSTFMYWLRKYRKDHALPSQRASLPSGFIPLKLTSDSAISQTPLDCEVKLPNGVLIRCHSASINSSLVNLIRLLLG
jgi:hypothetical protein